MGPITPEEAGIEKIKTIPEEMYKAINNLLINNMPNNLITIKQKDIVNEFLAITKGKHGFTKNDIYDKNWLNIEGAYREKGWKVTYEKPDYTEDFEAYFTFEVEH